MYYCEDENCTNSKGIVLDKMNMFIKGLIYLSKSEQKEERTCKECGKELVFISQYKKDGGYLATFNSKSDAEKKAILKKRAKAAMPDKKLNEIKRQKVIDKFKHITGQ